ncbi:hypothetical protein ACOMHN_049205 [Nucella lapillus]
MELEVVTSSSGRAVHEASSSSEVVLRVSFTDGKSQGDVSLYDCVAVAQDGRRHTKLTDFTGCPALQSPMGCMVEQNDLLVSPAFALSSLADYGDVNITCSWETCPAPHHPKCKNRCKFFTMRANLEKSRRRRSREGEVSKGGYGYLPRQSDTRRHSISTRIRVLPSHVRHRHHHGGDSSSAINHHGHHGNMQSSSDLRSRHPGPMMAAVGPSPLMYLNPIVCSLFLLLLSVFLGLYVSFVRSLGRSVQHIKTEIERQRARDKFLLPAYHEEGEDVESGPCLQTGRVKTLEGTLPSDREGEDVGSGPCHQTGRVKTLEGTLPSDRAGRVKTLKADPAFRQGREGKDVESGPCLQTGRVKTLEGTLPSDREGEDVGRDPAIRQGG